ncbi:MAG: ABC transporter ATP-binding protein [Clostridia bacterium]|nr:ABC transporter ATP-binding protein [Clostridia bacterium]
MEKKKDPIEKKKDKKLSKAHTKAATSRFWRYTKGYRFLTIICPIMILGDVIIELQIPKAMGKVIDLIYEANNPAYTGNLTAELSRQLAIVLSLCALTLVVGYIAARCSAIASMGFGANLRRELFNKTQSLSFENIDKLKISSLITRMTSDVSSVQNVYKNVIAIFVKGPFMLITALIYALNISTKLTSIFWVALPAIIVILAIMAYFAVPIVKETLKKTDEFNGVLRGNINGVRVVKAFVREEYEKEKFEKINTIVMKLSEKSQKLTLYITPAISLVIYGCMVVALWLGSDLIINGRDGLTTGDLSAFVAYITQVLTSLMTVLLIFLSVIMAKASIGRIGEVFYEEPTVTDKTADPSLTVEDGSIEYKNVCFRYNKESDKNIVDNVSFKINSGETIGIIGSTGSAKSSVVQLIPRLYDADEGQILVGGRDVRDYTFRNLRGAVSFVPQQNTLFSGSIRENIRWGNPDATDEEIEAAAKAAQAHEFIEGFEKGYDTELGQGGNTVSGGQRQRICIARALLRKPKVLIFDDSTSAVDTATDAKIKASLRSDDFRGITKIIIAQRITSIMDADRIIVIDNGRIEGIGTHNELKDTNKIYNEIFVSQQEGVLAQ